MRVVLIHHGPRSVFSGVGIDGIWSYDKELKTITLTATKY